jgi:hypothetical protein
MPPPPVRDPMHVHVDANPLRAAPGGARAQERHLRPHARQGAQARGRGGDVAAVVRGEEVRGREDVRRFDVVEADGADERRERLWRSGEDGGEGQAAGEGALQGVHRGGGDGVAGLRGEHEGEEGLEALVLGGGGWGVSEDGEWGWRGGDGGEGRGEVHTFADMEGSASRSQPIVSTGAPPDLRISRTAS